MLDAVLSNIDRLVYFTFHALIPYCLPEAPRLPQKNGTSFKFAGLGNSFAETILYQEPKIAIRFRCCAIRLIRLSRRTTNGQRDPH